jgi:hypothetical protein
MLREDKLERLTDPVSQTAADRLYLDTARILSDGLSQVLARCATASDPHQLRIAHFWNQSADANPNP